jgi:hypothetical protein
MNWKGFGRKRSWINIVNIAAYISGGTGKIMKNFPQNSWCSI